ncbi:twin-arginine translocation signal domain-containing protein [Halococcus salifodinae]|uniref:twin-arginine translocation signal domain-containing protein n=1 Tax=Halococcus salifodinae TaxID=36738 RepID=UPI001267DD56|nr:twin-arginine translocation signal domain-containing protein [Halococcus salifodinae]
MSEKDRADETAEAENHSSVNRRRFVKALGATGAAVGFSGMASADESEWVSASKKRIERLRQAPRVASLRKELNGLKITSNNTLFNDFESDGTGLTATKVTTHSGTLWFGETDEGNTTARFDFDTNPDLNSDRDRLPRQYRDIPDEVEAALIAKHNDVIFRRSATESEHRAIAEATGLETQNSVAATGSDIDGYYIMSRDPDSPVEYRVTVIGAAESSMTGEIDHADLVVDSVQKVTDETDKINAQAKCVTPCAACVVSVAGNCVPCYFTCAGSPTGIGAIACVYCLKVRCQLATGGLCVICLDCAEKNGYI